MNHQRTVLTLVLLTAACNDSVTETPNQIPPPPLDAVVVGNKTLEKVTDKATKLTIVQRHRERLPELSDTARLAIGDITHQQALAHVTGEDGIILMSRRAMRVGDVGVFSADGQMHTLGLARLENFLIGDDYAEFFVGSPDAVAKSQIDSILEQIETSKFTFRRNGQNVDGPAMAKYLRRKHTGAGSKTRTAHEFLVALGAKSTLGNRTHVVGYGGKNSTIAEWLGAHPSSTDR